MTDPLTTAAPGVSRRRSAAFRALAIVLFAAGSTIDIEPGAPILPLLAVVVVTAVQSATNGSPGVEVALAVASVLES